MRNRLSKKVFHACVAKNANKAATAALIACMPTFAMSDELGARDAVRYIAEFARSTPFGSTVLFIPNWDVDVKINGSEFRLDIGASEDLKDLCIIEENVPTAGRFIAKDLTCDGTLDELKVVQLGESVPRPINVSPNQQTRFEADAKYLARSIAALSLATPEAALITNMKFPDPFSVESAPEQELAPILASDIPLLQSQGTVAEGKYHLFWIEIYDDYKFQRIASTEERDGRPTSCLDLIVTPELTALGYSRIQFEAPNCQLDGASFFRVTADNKFEPIELTADERANWVNGFSRVLHYWNARTNVN